MLAKTIRITRPDSHRASLGIHRVPRSPNDIQPVGIQTCLTRKSDDPPLPIVAVMRIMRARQASWNPADSSRLVNEVNRMKGWPVCFERRAFPEKKEVESCNL